MTNFTRIVLIGFRGSGKTTIGRELAKLHRWEYISTDGLIEAHSRMPIAEIVNRKGWAFFRRREREIIQSLKDRHHTIIDCGGGAVENEENMRALSNDALVVWVDASFDDIYFRLQQAGDRPHLSHRDLQQDVEENYRRREPLYRRYSHLRVNTSESDIPAVCRLIMEKL